jgi:hypothetical protein
MNKNNVNIQFNRGTYDITFWGRKLFKVNFIYEHFNIAIKFFTLPYCMRFIENYLYNYFNFSKIDLLSIGSGNGLFEKCCQDVFGIKIICIDPSPLSFRSNGLAVEYIKPTYNTIDEYILSPTEKKAESFLLLIWTDPTLDYDIKAIIALKPLAFFIIYGTFPVAGSENIRDILEENESFMLEDQQDQQYKQMFVTTGNGIYRNQKINIKMSLCINITKADKYTEEELNELSYYKRELFYILKQNDAPQIENTVNLGIIL